MTEEEIDIKADEYALEESTACNYGESSRHVYQGYFYGFKKGAEFGYNKANEWHFVKDGDLPDNSRYVWTNVGPGCHNEDGWWNDFGGLPGVIAWCEPKFEED